MRPGQSFENREVAENYKYRPDYPALLFEKMIELSPRRQRALDLGCGTGKVAYGISKHFDFVTAIDASASMLDVAKGKQKNGDSNISWLCGLAEEEDLEGKNFDLIVAAASIHWMDHSLLFPHLQNHVGDDHVFVVIEGDGAHRPPWQDAWDNFLTKWIFDLTGDEYEPNRKDSAFAEGMGRHKKWLAMEGEASFESNVSQSIEDFVSCQYSRDTFAPSKLGRRIDEFTQNLRDVVGPYSDGADILTYIVQSRIEWGKIHRV